MDKTNAERQRRYVQRLKERAAGAASPDQILTALVALQPLLFPAGALEPFARQIIAEGQRLLGTPAGGRPGAQSPQRKRKRRPKAKQTKAPGKKAARPRSGKRRPSRSR